MNYETLLKMVGTSRDSAMLRYTLARHLSDSGKLAEAQLQLETAVKMNPVYTAAWKELGKVRDQAGNPAGAAKAWQRGVEISQENGDVQAAKEMTVFLKRLQRKS